MKRALVLLVGSVLLAACARHFVVKPEEVPARADRAWSVKAEPAPRDAARAAPAGSDADQEPTRP